LATLSDDELSGGPTMPMLPKTGDPETRWRGRVRLNAPVCQR